MQLPFKFHRLPGKQGKTKMACGLLKDSVEKRKNLRTMKRTLLNQGQVKFQFYFPYAPHFKKLN